ncbi:MAG: ATP-binding cassette domain-containing protein [Microthrixaceae bacterium]|nr:ATP-binding cassette domain-containing protein [Microthrixaceae bacterium]MCO5312850.1 ATP-binding cassette domain-containing protein [Microthrixaceae bacterium]
MAGSGTAHLRDDVLLRVENLVMEFAVKGTRDKVQAVSNISFDVADGETLGLVGESGCGKSTTGKAIMQLPKPTSGRVSFDGVDMTSLRGEQLRSTRPKMQMIFQDPISSLNPRRTITQIVSEPLRIWKRGSDTDRAAKVDEVLSAVGVDPAAAAVRRPHEFSGGQCQRISIARAVVTDPKLIICDEPVSALDVSVQAQVLNLLEDMKARYGLTMVFIAHDLAVVKNISDRIAVMYLGKMCEVAAPDALFSAPAHPYTRALISAIPHPDPSLSIDTTWRLEGDLPSPLNPPSGCRFRTRCPNAQDVCSSVEPQMTAVANADSPHYVACHFPLQPVTTPVTIGR